MFEAIMQAIAPQIVDLGIMTIVGLIGLGYRKVIGAEMDAKARDTLHSALSTGATLAISRLGPAATTAALTQATLDYVAQSSPQAVARLGASATVLQGLAESKLARLLN
ncbi:hypothetical protein [Paenirhodobacter populi]|uniref:Uncharacterized protein n=1 Tax=Paenirhodobacter populi TaxID=2306993 RepID=A0A443J1D4_9RHOB|nr:hypothetical protein [Sinirhodobacter populi]RWR14240.1 hypothetical protein D2T33_03210 [Sinirhodobacter populi]